MKRKLRILLLEDAPAAAEILAYVERLPGRSAGQAAGVAIVPHVLSLDQIGPALGGLAAGKAPPAPPGPNAAGATDAGPS